MTETEGGTQDLKWHLANQLFNFMQEAFNLYLCIIKQKMLRPDLCPDRQMAQHLIMG